MRRVRVGDLYDTRGWGRRLVVEVENCRQLEPYMTLVRAIYVPSGPFSRYGSSAGDPIGAYESQVMACWTLVSPGPEVVQT